MRHWRLCITGDLPNWKICLIADYAWNLCLIVIYA